MKKFDKFAGARAFSWYSSTMVQYAPDDRIAFEQPYIEFDAEYEKTVAS